MLFLRHFDRIEAGSDRLLDPIRRHDLLELNAKQAVACEEPCRPDLGDAPLEPAALREHQPLVGENRRRDIRLDEVPLLLVAKLSAVSSSARTKEPAGGIVPIPASESADSTLGPKFSGC